MIIRRMTALPTSPRTAAVGFLRLFAHRIYDRILSVAIGVRERTSTQTIMDVLLLYTPILDARSPYSAIAYLTFFLTSKGIKAHQADLSIGCFLKICSIDGLNRIRRQIDKSSRNSPPPSAVFFKKYFDLFYRAIGPATLFLQNREPSLVDTLSRKDFFPPDFPGLHIPQQEFSMALKKIEKSDGPHKAESLSNSLTREGAYDILFGTQDHYDRARYFSSLLLNNIFRIVHDAIDSDFHRNAYVYGADISGSHTFRLIEKKLRSEPTLIEQFLYELIAEKLMLHKPGLVGLSLPFAGCVTTAFRTAQFIKKIDPQIKVVIGGGFVSTHLRRLSTLEPFQYIDAVVLDAGEAPLYNLIQYYEGRLESGRLIRTFLKGKRSVEYHNNDIEKEVVHSQRPCPSFNGLSMQDYLNYFILGFPRGSPWNTGKWNPIVLAHGCYWNKCAFCTTELDCVQRYEPDYACAVVDKLEKVYSQTGSNGFHFVDEAMPPRLLKDVAAEIIRRRLQFRWWGNIRFEKYFTKPITELLAQSGCVGITGGLEAAHNRILKLMNKGLTRETIRTVTKNLSAAGIFVYAYLMYGFPTQTKQETMEALEFIRDLFQSGYLHGGFWHRFCLLESSTMANHPERFKIEIRRKRKSNFCNFGIPFADTETYDPDQLEQGLRSALANYMCGCGFETPVEQWFDV